MLNNTPILSSMADDIVGTYSEVYEIIDKMNCNPNEILFLDDNKDNIEGAKNCGLNTILVDKNMNIYEEIIKYIDKN